MENESLDICFRNVLSLYENTQAVQKLKRKVFTVLMLFSSEKCHQCKNIDLYQICIVSIIKRTHKKLYLVCNIPVNIYIC